MLDVTAKRAGCIRHPRDEDTARDTSDAATLSNVSSTSGFVKCSSKSVATTAASSPDAPLGRRGNLPPGCDPGLPTGRWPLAPGLRRSPRRRSHRLAAVAPVHPGRSLCQQPARTAIPAALGGCRGGRPDQQHRPARSPRAATHMPRYSRSRSKPFIAASITERAYTLTISSRRPFRGDSSWCPSAP